MPIENIMPTENNLSRIGKGIRYAGQSIHALQTFGFLSREKVNVEGKEAFLKLKTPAPDHLWHANTTRNEATGDLAVAALAIAVTALLEANELVSPGFVVHVAKYTLPAPALLLLGLGVSKLAGDLEAITGNGDEDYVSNVAFR